jgi:DNA-binding transcriptional regulator YhcF (GntR family)
MPRRPKSRALEPAPYVRIATDIRRRIARGELTPGARVPSTRELAKQWSVALATAAKALTVLQHEGMIRAQPRVGSVVAGTSARSNPRSARPEPSVALSRERIIQAAVGLADEQGLATLSMRLVAAKLAVPTMSLYGHVRDKQELLLLMIERVFAESAVPAEQAETWRAGLELAAKMQWALYRRHPWLAQVITLTRPHPLPNVIAHAEWVLRSIAGLGLDSQRMLDVHLILYSYVRGIAINLESEAEAEAETGLDEQAWGETQSSAWAALAESGRYPTFAHVFKDLSNGYDLDLNAIFELGLQYLLDGMARQFERTTDPPKQR